MRNKKISAVMAVYNREKYLKEAIESIINQTYDNWELILVNDASTDNSASICSMYRDKYKDKIKYINVYPNKGAGNSFYTGTINAKGDYIAYVGSDDIQLKDKFKIGVEFLNNASNIDLFFHNYETMNERSERTGRNLIFPNDINNNKKLLDYSLRRNYMYSGLAIVRNTKNIIFDESLRFSEDYDLFLRLISNGYKAAFSNEVLALNRIHSGNISARYSNSNEAVKYILNKYNLEELFNKLSNNGLSDNRINNTLGIVNIVKEDYHAALEFFSRFNFEDYIGEDFCDNLFYSATAYYKVEDYKQSLKCLERVLKRIPSEPTIYNNMAVLYSIFGDIDRAEVLLKEALNLQSLYMDAEINLKNLNSQVPLKNFTNKFLRKNVVHEKNAIF